MIFSVAWRNIWRSKLRSLIVITAISLGLLGILFILALSNGMVEQKIDASISNEISHIQLHQPKFLQDNLPEHAIIDFHTKIDEIQQIEGVTAACGRLKMTAMASTAAKGAGVILNGIEPEQEKKVTSIHECLIEGNYFEKKSKTPPILISHKLATNLKARPGSKIVLTLQNVDNEIIYGLCRVTGIYKTANSMFDEANVFVMKEDLAELINFDQHKATEIAVLIDHADLTNEITSVIQSEYPDLTVMSWKEMQPMLLSMRALMEQYSYIMLVVILIAMAFGIVNTMLMAILERTREIGMLMAVGMNKQRIFLMIMLETIFLSVTGAFIGMVLAYATISLTNQHGLNFASVAEGFEAYGYSALVYPILYTRIYVGLTILVFFTAILSSIYPARKALKLKPAEAIRADT
ncbi:MAG: ABC transporter permease [Bacteroidales bacterium]|nr:ABC transporter permease [Bacteroidales bacterium]